MITCIVHNADTQARTRMEASACHAGEAAPVIAVLGEGTTWAALIGEDRAGAEQRAGFIVTGTAVVEPISLREPANVACAAIRAEGQVTLSLSGYKAAKGLTIELASLPRRILAWMAAEPKRRLVLLELASAILVTAARDEGVAAQLQRSRSEIDGLGPDAAHALLASVADMLRGFQRYESEAVVRREMAERRPSRVTQVHLAEALVRAQRFDEAESEATWLFANEAAFLHDRHGGLVEALDARRRLREAMESAALGLPLAANPSPRIAYCLHDAPPQSWGGYAVRSHGLARALKAEGAEIVALARPRMERPGSLVGDFEVDGIDYRFSTRFGRRGRPEAYLADSVGYYAEQFREHGIGLVQAASNYHTALPAGLAAHALGLPFVYEVRSFWNITREARDPGALDTPEAVRDRLFERTACALADHIVTLTPAMTEELRMRGVEPERIGIVPNCVDTKAVMPRPRDAATAARYGIAEGDIVIGYVGAILGYEGLPLLVEAASAAMRDNPRAKLLIVGADMSKAGSPGTVEYDIANAIERYGIGKRATLAPRVPHDEVANVYSVMDILAYPRLGHRVCELVSPLKPLEAMAMGKAVIASDVGGMRDMAIDGRTALVFPNGDAQALAAALEMLVANPDLRARLGGQARNFVVEERDWRHAARALLAAHGEARIAWRERPHTVGKRLDPILETLFRHG